jgi:hypothetical protein
MKVGKVLVKAFIITSGCPWPSDIVTYDITFSSINNIENIENLGNIIGNIWKQIENMMGTKA